jgi:hypothetical protein
MRVGLAAALLASLLIPSVVTATYAMSISNADPSVAVPTGSSTSVGISYVWNGTAPGDTWGLGTAFAVTLPSGYAWTALPTFTSFPTGSLTLAGLVPSNGGLTETWTLATFPSSGAWTLALSGGSVVAGDTSGTSPILLSVGGGYGVTVANLTPTGAAGGTGTATAGTLVPVTVSPTSVPATSTSTIGITFGAVAATCTSDSSFVVTTSGGTLTATSLPGVTIPSGGTTSVGVPCSLFGSVAGSSLTLQAPTTPSTTAVSVILASVGGESVVDSATSVTFTTVSASSGSFGGIGRGARKLRFYPATVTGTCAAAAAEPTIGVTTFGSATLATTGRNRLTITVALRGATPDTTYAVYVDQSGACSASPRSITTNARGNGTGRARVALVSGATQLWVTATSATTAFVTPAVTLMAQGRGSFWGAPRGRGFRAH